MNFLSLSASLVGAAYLGIGVTPASAQVVILQQQRVIEQTRTGVSFTYSNPVYLPIYPNGVSVYPRVVYTPGGGRTVFVNPTIVNSPIYNSTVINPTIVPFPVYGYPYGNSNTVTIIDRPSPQIVVDPQYGVRFKEPTGY